MAEQIRSAELLVTKALADPEIKASLTPGAEEKLKDLSQDAMAQTRIPAPSKAVSNVIWVIIVSAFAIIMLGSAYVLARSIFTPLAADTTYMSNTDVMVTLFTTSVAFLAGLLTPSPVSTNNTSANNNT
jgi:hypothetical protein